MPPPVPSESDAESVAADEVNDSKVEAEPSQSDEVMKDPADNAEEEDEDDEDGEEIFVVEKILSHHDNFEDNAMRYEIKWKGYELKKDRTWETEANLAGAREILERYWKEIGGRPKPTVKAKNPEPKATGKKRGRQSTGSQIEEKPAKKQQKRGRKSTSAIQDSSNNDDDGFPVGYADVNPDTWKPPPPNDNAWDPLVMQVDTIEKDNDGELWAYLVWNEKNDDGRFNRSKARTPTCNKACPQKMLQFYEKHVVFTNNKSNYIEENGATAVS